MSKYYMAIGTFDFKRPHGILTAVFDDSDLSFSITGSYEEGVNAGNMYYDKNRKVLYVCDETDGHLVSGAGGGTIYAFKVVDHLLKLMNHINTYMTKTCYCHMDGSGKYLLYANHTNRKPVTKVKKNDDGLFETVLVSDDGGVGMIALNEDGSLDKVKDMVLYEGYIEEGRYRQPHCHSINLSPDGKIFYACDKGLDRIYSYSIDYENGKIVPLQVTQMEKDTAPRYTAFHPILPVIYENNETSNILYAFRYDTKTGSLEKIGAYKQVEDGEGVTPSDLVSTHAGDHLYSATRNCNRLIAFRIREDGTLEKIREYDMKEDAIRGLCISEDDRYLMAMASGKSEILIFRITENGEIEFVKKENVPMPGCLRFLD